MFRMSLDPAIYQSARYLFKNSRKAAIRRASAFCICLRRAKYVSQRIHFGLGGKAKVTLSEVLPKRFLNRLVR